MRRRLLTILTLLFCFYLGKKFSDFEHRPIVIEIHSSHLMRGQQTT